MSFPYKIIFSVMICSGILGCSSRAKLPSPESREGIQEAIQSRGRDYKNCFEHGMRGRPPVYKAKVVVNVIVEKNGVVSEGKVKSSDLHSQFVEQCILKVMKSTRFPSNSHSPVTIDYPFTFSSRSLGASIE